jgi:hypothetical protein
MSHFYNITGDVKNFTTKSEGGDFTETYLNDSVYMWIGARGGVVVKALRYNGQVVGSIPGGVIGILQKPA